MKEINKLNSEIKELIKRRAGLVSNYEQQFMDMGRDDLVEVSKILDDKIEHQGIKIQNDTIYMEIGLVGDNDKKILCETIRGLTNTSLRFNFEWTCFHRPEVFCDCDYEDGYYIVEITLTKKHLSKYGRKPIKNLNIRI